ncbi:hypothetical protein ABBQ38_011030 [Trebouxia sp. C0009 RCD-2024]
MCKSNRVQPPHEAAWKQAFFQQQQICVSSSATRWSTAVSQVSMVTVAQFIDSIEHLTVGSKSALKRHVQMEDFGANLDADCNELFKETLQENLPATFNVRERTAVKRILKHPGDHSAYQQAGPSKKARTGVQATCVESAKTALVKDFLKPLRHLPAAGDFWIS